MPRCTMEPVYGWEPASYGLCSNPRCRRYAVLKRTDTVAKWSDKVATHRRTRRLCKDHAEQYGMVCRRGRYWYRWSEARTMADAMRCKAWRTTHRLANGWRWI